ncbi:MAG: M3 family metallopeptidase [Bacteroidales bacterium]|nr:M3 family metallopeptidase [Bacteroidales bacterium]
MNVFLEKYKTPYETVPFNEIKFEDYEEAMMEGMRREDADLQRMIDNPEEPTFENTIDTDDDKTLSRVTTTFFNLLSAHTNDEMDALAQKMAPLLTEHSQNIILNEKYFARVKALKEKNPKLTPEEQMLFDNIYEGFERNGATLPEDKKQVFRQLQQELSMLTLQFSQNELKDTNEFTLHITDESELKGLPQTAMDAASLAAKEAGKEGWLFTLHAPSFTPFMTYCENRELRRQMYMARNTLCTHPNEYNNEQVVKRIVNLRREIAQLLGYRNWAEYVLKRRMAEKIENVNDLLEKLIDAYLPAARQELAEVEAIAKQHEGDDFQLMPWDFAHYSHLLKMERYNIDAEMLRPYFELKRVKEGVFGLATRLYGITFHKRDDIQVYHPEVEAWEVRDENDQFLAVLYTDFHPRKSKQSGAWMTSYKEQWQQKVKSGKVRVKSDGEDVTSEEAKGKTIDSRPIVSVTMNFTKPTETAPALLTLSEVETFLHEFGHALHGMFSKVRFEALSCTNVYWDFVELPSQFMENYAIEPEFLHTFARHYQTDEPIPDDLIDRIRKSRNFNVAYACIRQVSFGLLDMAYYTMDVPFDEDVKAFEKKVWERIQLMPTVDEACMSVQFGHIMSGGYSAGYYSYKWAEVLDADAFSVFQQEGIFNKDTAARFRNEVLSRGGTEPPMTLYKRFRGGEPSIDALLRRNGILN